MEITPADESGEKTRDEMMAELAKMPLGGNMVGNLRAIRLAREIQRRDAENSPSK